MMRRLLAIVRAKAVRLAARLACGCSSRIGDQSDLGSWTSLSPSVGQSFCCC